MIPVSTPDNERAQTISQQDFAQVDKVELTAAAIGKNTAPGPG